MDRPHPRTGMLEVDLNALRSWMTKNYLSKSRVAGLIDMRASQMTRVFSSGYATKGFKARFDQGMKEKGFDFQLPLKPPEEDDSFFSRWERLIKGL